MLLLLRLTNDWSEVELWVAMATKGVACDVCAKKSARWYCSADAAYLCDLCDAQVHTANSLARRHERLRVTPTGGKVSSKKRLSPQVLPARKRTRSSRPHPHRPQCTAHDQGMHIQMEEINLEDFLVDHPQEVPSLITDSSSQEYSSHSMSHSSHSSLQSPDCNSPASFRSSDDESSFAAYFKGKAALTEAVIEFEAVVPTGIDIICCDADGNISMADDDACFLPGDIPGLDAFDDCSLSFDLAHTVPTGTTFTALAHTKHGHSTTMLGWVLTVYRFAPSVCRNSRNRSLRKAGAAMES